MRGKRKATGAATPVASGSKTISPSNTETDNSLTNETTTQIDPLLRDPHEPSKYAEWMAGTWAVRNPNAWDVMCGIAVQKAEAGQRVGMQDLVEYIRWHEFTDVDGKPTKVDNNLSPALARLLCQERPVVRPYMELRRSRFDANGSEDRS